MANSRPSDRSDPHPGGYRVSGGTGRGQTGHEAPSYHVNGHEHQGREQGQGLSEPGELAHDHGYLRGWGARAAYHGTEPGDAGPVFLPRADPWDAPDGRYAFPGTWRRDERPAPFTRGPRTRPGPGIRQGRGGGRGVSRSPRAVLVAGIVAAGLMATALVLRWAGAPAASGAPPARAAGTAAAGARAGGMPGAGPAAPSYRLIAARQADGFGYNAAASRTMATAPATAGGLTELGRCLEAKGLTAGGTVTGVRYAQYNDGKDVTGLSLIGFTGSFGADAARRLWQAAGGCGVLAPGAAVTTPAPGPHGGTLYTGTGNPGGTTCVWATGSTAAYVWFFSGATGLTVRDPAAACRAVRSAVEARSLCRTRGCRARA